MSTRAWGTILVIVALLTVGSLVFLQNRGAPRPSTYEDIGTELGSGRIERPDVGIAVTTPAGWAAWQPSTDFQDWWNAGTWVHLWMEPEATTDEWWMGTCDIGQDCDLERMVTAGGEAYCWVADDTELAAEAGWRSPATPARDIAAGLAAQEGWSAIETAVEELPNGEASVLRAVDPNGWQQEIWHLTDGARWYRVLCGVLDSDLQPRTLSETFEFMPLPAEY
mgnify:CR=1 FL=1